MNKIFKRCVNVLLIIAILLLVIYFALRISGKMKIYQVETGSMEDNIHVGDYILLCKKESYNVNDIVTYQKDKYFITHRIIKKENGLVITKGDANNVEDEEIKEADIIGKVIYCGGFLNIIINYKFAIIALLLGLYVLSCYINDKEK